ncbi:uncharacterized protein ddias [Coregonus clupeaformis]|uniref:uncharacterized protein ddias n=1 Tax=Coregonus clupeaformis TaxID=59861 RepID=UPI001E1C75FC|nr:uncharacterized protein ddias [Coregonus clupeaformis]
MSVRRALVDCAVLSLQDSCVLYPCCRGCFSRMRQTDKDRWHCSRCCYSCLEQQLDYRYRLSLRVTRDHTIFGVTVFGSCLNPLFGAPATHLHRLVEESSGPMGGGGQRSGCRSRLLVKAVEDCFIGRHFVFGIKISGPLPYRRESGQFIACQISLPLDSAPGCSVVSYYRTLLQQAALCADWATAPQPSADTSTAPLLLHPSPLCSFNSTLPSCGRSLSLHRTLTLTPTSTFIHTAHWQQSPGVITSSAEQEEEEGCSSEGGGEVTGRQRAPTVSRWLTVCEEGEREEEVSTSPHGPSQGEGGHSRNSSQGEGGHSRNSRQGDLRKMGVSDTEEECRSECEQTCLSDCVAWEDLPFSECLGEFVWDPADTETRTPTDHQAQTSPVGRNLSTAQRDTEDSHTHIKDSHTQLKDSHTPRDPGSQSPETMY